MFSEWKQTVEKLNKWLTSAMQFLSGKPELIAQVCEITNVLVFSGVYHIVHDCLEYCVEQEPEIKPCIWDYSWSTR